ncbi:MAG: hypothetical protein AB7T63_07325 [Planctomycetota bacterium]
MRERATSRWHRLAVIATALAVVAAGPAGADEGRYVVRYDDARSTVASERLLDNLERAFSEVLEAKPDAVALRHAADRLVASREMHTGQMAEAEATRVAVEEAKARLERDERQLLQRRTTPAWEQMTAAERTAQESRENEYLGRIRAALANRETKARQAETALAPTRALLAAYGGSWGALAIERAVIEPQRILRLSGTSWQRAMLQHADRFNAYVDSRHGSSPCVLAEATRPLLSHRIPAGAMATGMNEPGPAAPRMGPDLPAPAPDQPAPPPYGRPAPYDPYAPTPTARPSTALGPADAPGPADPLGPRGAGRDAPYGAPGGEFEPVFPGAPGKPVLAPGGAPTRAPHTEMHGGFLWYLDWDDAAAEARRTGRLVYCLSTRDQCHMCEAVRDESVAAYSSEMQRFCVGYLYDIMNPAKDPRISRVDGFLRTNLVGYSMMPLTGWVTPDLKWVHGFHGWKKPDDFRAEMTRARALMR